MKEVQTILQVMDRLDPHGSFVLATVVRVQGSAYRRPGARMLLLPDGQAVGTVSGGCLEGDVKLRAWRLTADGRPSVIRYDSTSTGDMAWQLGLGCQGIVDVLVERVSPATADSPLRWLRRWLDERRCGVLARVVAVRGAVDVPVGAFTAFDESGRVGGDFDPSVCNLQPAVFAALEARRSSHVSYDLRGGTIEVFFEVVQPPLALLVCGAGHDAIPLVAMAKTLGWHVTVIDPRPTYATRERFPGADAIHVAEPEELLVRSPRGVREILTLRQRPPLPVPEGGAAVIMTHNYSNDRIFLRALLPAPLRYLGVLGPRSRAERLLDELTRDGVPATADQLARLHGPVGLNVGAETPEEIAVAVIAEIQAVLAGRDAGFLRDSPLPIHERPVRPLSLEPPQEFGERCCLAEAT